MSTPQIVPSDGTPAAVSTSVAALPGARPGWHSLNPYLALHDAEGAIEWYKKALDATEISRLCGADQRVLHAELLIQGGHVMLCDAAQFGLKSARELGSCAVGLVLFVADPDALFQRALDSGATENLGLGERFWGDRCGMLTDPYGQSWTIARRVEELSDEEAQGRFDEMLRLELPKPDRVGERKQSSAPLHWRPANYAPITPFVIVRGPSAALDFYQRAFGAVEESRLMFSPQFLSHAPGGDAIDHVKVRVHGALVMLSTEMLHIGKKSPLAMEGSATTLCLYVGDVDAVFAQAVKEGAQVVQQPRDEFYGERSGVLRDPFGHRWHISTFQREVSQEEMQRAMDSMGDKTGEASAQEKKE